MASKVTVKANKAKIAQLKSAQMTALSKTAEALHTEIVQAQVIPFAEGELQKSTHVDFTRLNKGKARLVANTPYARRMYFHPEYNFSKEENPNARGEWLYDWGEGAKKDRAKKLYKKFFKQEVKK